MEEGDSGQWGIMGEEGREAVPMSSRGGTRGTAWASTPHPQQEWSPASYIKQAGRCWLWTDPSLLVWLPGSLCPALGSPEM